MRRPIKLSELESPRLTALIYGAPGVGKTVLACGSQALRGLLLDVDKGAISARTWAGSPTQGLGPTQLERVRLHECTTFQDVMDGLAEAGTHAADYDLLIIDSLTELQRTVMDEIKRQQRGEVLDQRGWGITLTMMDTLMRSIKALPLHVLCTAHEECVESGEHPGRYEYRPAFQGKFRDWYARHFTLISRYTLITVENKDPAGQRVTRLERALQCHKTPQAHAKDRVGALDLWERPSLDHVLQKIEAKLAATRATSPTTATQVPTPRG